MHEHIGEHILWHIPVLGPVHADTIVTTWLVMIVALVFLGWIGASYRSPYVTKRQAVLEAVFNYIADLVTSVLGEDGEPFVPGANSRHPTHHAPNAIADTVKTTKAATPRRCNSRYSWAASTVGAR